MTMFTITEIRDYSKDDAIILCDITKNPTEYELIPPRKPKLSKKEKTRQDKIAYLNREIADLEDRIERRDSEEDSEYMLDDLYDLQADLHCLLADSTDNKENTKDTTMTENTDKRFHLRARMYDIKSQHDSALRDNFRMAPVKGPKTWNELVEKIKSGDYTFDENHLSRKMSTYSMMDWVSWTKDKPDSEGYEQAKEKLEAAFKKTFDRIEVLDPVDGLKAMEDFEAQTFI